MKLESRRHKQESGRLTAQRNTREVTMLAEFPAVQMPANAHPIIQTLKRQMEVGEGLQLDNGQPARVLHRHQIDDAALASGKRRQLPVNRRPHERRIHRFDSAAHLRFEPRFRVAQIQFRLPARSYRAQGSQFAGETLNFGELLLTNRIETAESKNDTAFRDARKLQSTHT